LVDIFQEVTEELRQEQAAQLWHKYSRYVYAAAGLVLLATAGFVTWRDRQHQQAEAQGAQLATLMSQAAGDPARVAKDLALMAQNGTSGYRLIARFEAALMTAQTGDAVSAVASLEAIADDGSVDQPFRDLALILAAGFGIDGDGGPALVKRLAPLTIAPNAWRFSASELTALADWKAGNRDEALKRFQQLSDDLDAPPSLRARATEIVAAYPH
jgi:hypothetical protein